MIGVSPFDGDNARSLNTCSIRRSAHWLRSGGLLVVFPAGDIAYRRLPGLKVTDAQWGPLAARLAGWSEAPVLPVFFHGANSWSFYAAGALHPRVRDALLAREIARKAGQTISVSIGAPFDISGLVNQRGWGAATDCMRQRTFQLAGF
jgi:putative hemolysin